MEPFMSKLIFSRRLLSLRTLLLLLALFPAPGVAAETEDEFALGTAFHYQGRLQQEGRAAEGSFDLTFELFDAALAGQSLGRVDRLGVPVRGGVFDAELDFGHPVFAGEPAWLEISVRTAGEGGFTTLSPRQRLAGESVALCTVNSDVLVNGHLDVDPPDTAAGIGVACCNEAGLDGGGQIALHGFLSDLLLDANEIQARSLLEGGPLHLNPHGGNVGIGVATANAPLQLPSAPDAEPGSGGVLVVGSTAGVNLAVDGNEIMARDSGAPSTLFLNNDGGDVVVGGALDIGYTIAIHELSTDANVGVICPAGLKVLGGGCWTADSDSDPDALLISIPSPDGTGWSCKYDSDDIGLIRAYAVCARVK
jgi:hypothetical protein